MKALVLIGGGGHCRSCIDVVEAESIYAVAGIIDRDDIETTGMMNYPLLGNDDQLPELIKKFDSALVTVGQIKSPDVRIRLYENLKHMGAELPVIVSPNAYLSRHANVGAGSIIMHGAVVTAQARIGENCIINSQALVEHDGVVGSHCHISTGAKLNGGVKIGRGTFVGSGAVIREGVCIGSQCLVAAGAIVLNDLPDGTVYQRKQA